MNFFEPVLPQELETQLIDPAFTRPRAIIAAMMSASYAAAVRIADGATWEGEPGIVVDPGLRSHADRMALIWRRAAENLQGAPSVAIRPRPRSQVGQDKRSPCRFRGGPPPR